MPNNWRAIPAELRQRAQWCVSTMQLLPNGKPDKAPRRPDGTLASVKDPSTWCTFEQASNAGFPALGFVLTGEDPFAVVDLDYRDADGNVYPPAIIESQKFVYGAFDGTYAERSISGEGCHIITAGAISGGVRRTGIEVYDRGRYIITTGDVVRPAPIVDLNGTIHDLVDSLGGIDTTKGLPDDIPENDADENILAKLRSARNGENFAYLFDNRPAAGQDWSRCDSQLAQFIAYHTRNHEQALRLFRMSALYRGTKGGYSTVEKYERDYLLRQTFGDAWRKLDNDRARKQPFIDHGRAIAEQLFAKIDATNAATITHNAKTADALAKRSSARSDAGHDDELPGIPCPPGLLGGIASFIYRRGFTLCWEAALGGAIGLLAGITGRQYQTYTHSGLTQYVVIVGHTGTGKENASTGVDALINAMPISQQVFARRYIGGNPQSAQALIKDLAEDPSATKSLVVRYGEMGLMLKGLTDPRAFGAAVSLRRALLDLFSKSGADSTLEGLTYSDRKTSTQAIHSPNFTFVGDTTPGTFYSVIDSDMAAEGFVPRLTLLETDALMPVDNDDIVMDPDPWVTTALNDVISVTTQHKLNNHFQFVQPSAEAAEVLQEYKVRNRIDMSSSEEDYRREIINRAYLKVLRLATLVAVGCNWNMPVVEAAHVRWAIQVIDRGHEKLLRRFDTGEAGGGESAMELALIQAVMKWTQSSRKFREGFSASEAVRESTVLIPRRWLRRTLEMRGPVRQRYRDPSEGAKILIATAIADKLLRDVTISEKEQNGVHGSSVLLTLGSEFQNAALMIKYKK